MDRWPFLGGAVHNDGVTGVVGNAAGLRQDFKKSDGRSAW